MSYLANNAGATTGALGNQRLGTIVLNQGTIRQVVVNPVGISPTGAIHNGEFNGNQLISLNTISGKFDGRYDNPTYYG